VAWFLLLTGAILVGASFVAWAARTTWRAQKELKREIDRSTATINQAAEFFDRLDEANTWSQSQLWRRAVNRQTV